MWFAMGAILAYLISVLLIIPTLITLQQKHSQQKPNKKVIFIFGIIAIILHILSVVDTYIEAEQAIGFFMVFAMMMGIASLVVTFALLYLNSVWLLLPIIYSLGVISLVFSIFIPLPLILQLSDNLGLTGHIGLALLSYALCFIATLYSIQYKWIDYRLKNKNLPFSQVIPPLMSVERHFFRLLLLGEGSLTLTLLTGMVYLPEFFAQQNIHKAVFSFLAWLVLGFVIFGQWRLHWRGKRVVFYTSIGMILLTIAYFGSRALWLTNLYI